MPQTDNLTFRRKQRAMASRIERILWACLRDRRFMNLKFRRQQSIGPYVADFYCDSLKLIVEADGMTHQSAEAIVNDAKRDEWLKAQGHHLVRLHENEILTAVSLSLKRVESVVHNLRGS